MADFDITFTGEAYVNARNSIKKKECDTLAEALDIVDAELTKVAKDEGVTLKRFSEPNAVHTISSGGNGGTLIDDYRVGFAMKVKVRIFGLYKSHSKILDAYNARIKDTYKGR